MSVKRPGSELISDKSEKRAASEDTLLIFGDHFDDFENFKSTKMDQCGSDVFPIDKIDDKIGTCLKKIIFGEEYRSMLREFFELSVQPIATEIGSLKVKTDELNHKTEELEVRVQSLENKVDFFEQGEKNNTVIILNPWKENKDENVTEIISRFFSQILNVPLGPGDVVKAHRIGKLDPTSGSLTESYPRSILVTFSSSQLKIAVKKARAVLKHDDKVKGIYINDDLTKRRRMMLKTLLQLKRDKSFSDCWSYNGKIMYKSCQGVVFDAFSKPPVSMGASLLGM